MNHNLIKRIFLIIPVLFALAASVAEAAIPDAERQVLIAIYNGTGGAGWTNSTNWNGAAGTECTWFGVICDGGQTTVTSIDLNTNNLTGSLPATLNNLTGLVTFYVNDNQLTGSIPSLVGLTNLAQFYAQNNQLSGNVPAVPAPTNALSASGSSLCPNYLNQTADAAWDTATGSTPWYDLCTAAPIPVAAAPIPTLSQWGMIVLSILLVGAAVFGLRRQR